MATARDVTTSSARPPLAGHRPLFAGEDAAAYDSLLRRVTDVVKPADVLEEIWLEDVVELSWEVARLRRMKAEFLNSSAHRGLRKLLDGLLGWKESQDLTAQWAGKDPDAVKLVEADYRSVFAAHLRRATSDIQDAEFQVIPSQVVSSRPALPQQGQA
jgi:hypothetical protein